MRIVDFGPAQGREINSFDSKHLWAVGLIRDDDVSVTALHVGAGGEIGRHPAAVDQLFLVVSGRGSVCGDDGEWQPVSAGQAVLWAAGEHHGTRADGDLTAIVVEMPDLPVTR
jgi:quercetin dioxygenase-like cupin family protein